MMRIEKAEDGNACLVYDDETLQGNFFRMDMEDRFGMELLAQLVDFYEAKGLRPMLLLNQAAVKTKRAWWRRIFFGAQ